MKSENNMIEVIQETIQGLMRKVVATLSYQSSLVPR